MYVDRLIEIRKDITSKRKEIIELESEKEDLWKKILRELNDNKARYKKMEGLSGFKEANLGKIELVDSSDFERVINILFDKNSKPTAKALSYIESDTGLKFKGNNINPDNYGFGL